MIDSTLPSILVVEDDRELALLIQGYLSKHGYGVSIEHNGNNAVKRIAQEMPDMVILDIMLPGKDGLSICSEVRPAYNGLILMLTAKGEEIDEIVGLEMGADDYLAKPVSPRRLLARVKSLHRRSGSDGPSDTLSELHPASDAKLLQIGHLKVDAANHKAYLNEESLELTSGEFDLLWYLANNRGRTVSREELSQALRGIPYDGLDRNIDLRVTRLRKKLADDGKHPKIIKSIRGAGYLFVEEP
jgi:two-component system response regulator RstA